MSACSASIVVEDCVSVTTLQKGRIRDVHRNFEGQLLSPEKKGQHVNFCHCRCHGPSPGRIFCPYHIKLSLTTAATPPSPGRIFCLYHFKLSLTAAATPLDAYFAYIILNSH